MNADQLFELIGRKKSFLCLGLDTDPDKIPTQLRNADDPIFEFNKRIIDATSDLIVACKPNFAFYESHGAAGIQILHKTVAYIRDRYPDIFLIADAKRGDIFNTSVFYAKSFFESSDFDAVTLSPYMGRDSIAPYLAYSGKWAILLALTSNPGSDDFQLQNLSPEGEKLYERVLRKGKEWGNPDQVMFVVGATHPGLFENIRKIVPDHFILVPGVGAQGGELSAICQHGLNSRCGLLVNLSRSILYASSGIDFDTKAREHAELVRQEMEGILLKNKLL